MFEIQTSELLCLKRPPVNLAQTKFFFLETSFQWPPLHKNHFFRVTSVINKIKILLFINFFTKFLNLFFSTQVTFPAVTICSPGMTESNLEAGFYKLFLGFLAKNNLTVPFVSAFNASAILKKVCLVTNTTII